MKRHTPWVVMIVAALATTACGGSKSPTAPAEVIANYAGGWSGQYSITGCTQNGGIALANICGSLGQTPPYNFSLTQASRNVSGTFSLGSIQFPSTGGTVGQDGSLQLNATSKSNGVTIIVAWNLRMTGTQMNGTISQQWASDTLSGNVSVSGTINTAIHGAASTAPAALIPRGITASGLGQLAARP